MNKIGLLFLLILLTHCSGSEVSPVTLPIPFSGNLRLDTDLFTEGGFPIETNTVLGPTGIPHLAGTSWELADPDGLPVGTFSQNANEISELFVEGGVIAFRIPTRLDLSDGSSLVIPETEFTVFLTEELPTVAREEAIAFSGEPDASPVVVHGVASGRITEATGSFEGTIGGFGDYSFVHQPIAHSDGALTFFFDDRCSWVIEHP